jgi:hypothetical protein
MAPAGQHFGDVSRVRDHAGTATGRVSRRLVMSAENMPRFGMYEPAVERTSTWIRAVVVAGGGIACWGIVAAIWLLAF